MTNYSRRAKSSEKPQASWANGCQISLGRQLMCLVPWQKAEYPQTVP
nr:MAG TPA: hypothetical protein [Caudoviricetes sp.]